MSSDDVVTDFHPIRNEQPRSEDPLPPEDPVEVDDRPFAPEAERYQFQGRIGKGGMGDVMIAKDMRIARQVAVKLLKPEIAQKREFRSRFLVEARLQGQLEHPSIVPVHDLGVTPDGELFFSMKCIRGVTLHDALRAVKNGERSTRFSRQRLLRAFSSVCLAVDFAHTRGVVHRDLKPANVMLGGFGEVYVLDWGIAKLVMVPETPLEAPIELPDDTDEPETRAGMVLGTPQYMAPERKAHGVASPQTDVFALGKILEEILAAEPRDVPPELAAIVASATASLTENRFASARALHEVLEKYLDGDRDMELRRTQAEQHAALAEDAIARPDQEHARADAAREIGRALGLDPTNTRAMRTLMRLLTEVPAQMPAAAQAEIDRVWQARRTRTLRFVTLIAGSWILYVPFILWMGVRDWPLFFVWIVLALGGVLTQWIASFSERTLPFAVAICLALGAHSVLTTSMGITGYVPAAFAVIALAWRISVRRWSHGVMIVVGLIAAMLAPFVLSAVGVMSPFYEIRDDTLVVLPHMHHFPAVATIVAVFLGTIGAVAAAVLHARVYSDEMERAERRLTFNAWQLQQLLAPQR